MTQLPVAGTLWLRSPFFVRLCHRQRALPKLLALHWQGLTQAGPQLWVFSNYYWFVEALAHPLTVMRMVWHWDPGRSICGGGWWEDREQPVSHPQIRAFDRVWFEKTKFLRKWRNIKVEHWKERKLTFFSLLSFFPHETETNEGPKSPQSYQLKPSEWN